MNGPVEVLLDNSPGMDRSRRDSLSQQNGSLAIRRASLEDAALLTSLSTKPQADRRQSAPPTSTGFSGAPAVVPSAPLMAEITELLRPRPRKRKLAVPAKNLDHSGAARAPGIASASRPAAVAAAADAAQLGPEKTDPLGSNLKASVAAAANIAGVVAGPQLPAVIRDFVKKEGNRIAAKRCREKKKLYIEALQQRVELLEAQNVELQRQLNEARAAQHAVSMAANNEPAVDDPDASSDALTLGSK